VLRIGPPKDEATKYHGEKRLVPVGDEKTCEACKEAASRGWIPIAEPFDPRAPQYTMDKMHPCCRCRKDTR